MESGCHIIASLYKRERYFLFLGVLLLLAGIMLLTTAIGCGQPESTDSPSALNAFVGAASKPPMEEAARAFEKETGIKVFSTYGGSGAVLSQMKLAKSGDLYIPGSPDYMVKAERDGVIEPKTVKIIVYLIPVIAVQRGNPRNIQSLADLARPGIKVGIANPEAVCVGLYAIEILDYNRLLAEVSQNIITHAESCEKTATLISLKAVDAVIGWHVFHDWDPDNIDVVYLKAEQIPRIAYIPAAISTYTKDREGARKFIDFLISQPAQDIFLKWGYITSESDARKFAPGATIGGEYQLPESYRSLIK